MVIQRWQSVMLLIAGVMMGLFSFLSLGQVQTADYSFNITALGIMREGIATAAGEPEGVRTIVSFVLCLLACIMPLVGIFCFRNMRLHKSIAIQSALYAAVAAALVIGEVYMFSSEVNGAAGWSSLIAAPFIAIVADLIAFRMISSDWKKMRAADRLR